MLMFRILCNEYITHKHIEYKQTIHEESLSEHKWRTQMPVLFNTRKQKVNTCTVINTYVIRMPFTYFYLFLDLLLLLFFALFVDLFLLESLLLLWHSFTGVETCSKLPLDIDPFVNWIGALSELLIVPLFWTYPVWIEVWFFPLASLLLLEEIVFELPKLQLSSLPLFPIWDSDSLYRSTGSRDLMLTVQHENKWQNKQQKKIEINCRWSGRCAQASVRSIKNFFTYCFRLCLQRVWSL